MSTSTHALAATIRSGEKAVQIMFWQAGSNVPLFIRAEPTASAPKPAWTHREIPGDFLASPDTVSIFLDTNLYEFLPGSTTEVTVDGFWSVELTEQNKEEINEGVVKPRSLVERVRQAMEGPAPRHWSYDSVSDTSKAIAEGPLAAVVAGDPLDEWCIGVLGVAPASNAAPLVDPDEGIELIGTQDVYYPRPGFVPGRTDVDAQVQAFSMGWAVAYLGPPGTGKTTLIQAAAKVWRGVYDIEVVDGKPSTQPHHIVGQFQPTSVPGEFVWVDGPLLRAMRSGCPLLVDEFGRIPMDVMTVFYPLLDGRNQITVDDNPAMGVIEAKEGFALAFASNPDHPSFELDEPLASRFAAMPELLTDWNLMRKLVGADKVNQTLVDACENLDAKRRNGEMYFSPQARDVTRFVKKADVWGRQVALQELITRVGRIGTEADQDTTIETLERALGVGNLTTLVVGGAGR